MGLHGFSDFPVRGLSLDGDGRVHIRVDLDGAGSRLNFAGEEQGPADDYCV